MTRTRNGFTLIEVLIVIGIIGVAAMAVAPEIINSLEVRGLENTGREILISLERAKFQAVKTKENHRIRFDNSSGHWLMLIEIESTPGTWTSKTGTSPRSISSKYNMTVNLPDPDLSVEFSHVGTVDNYDQAKSSIILQSDKLRRHNQPDQCEVRFFFSGSTKFVKSQSY